MSASVDVTGIINESKGITAVPIHGFIMSFSQQDQSIAYHWKNISNLCGCPW